LVQSIRELWLPRFREPQCRNYVIDHETDTGALDSFTKTCEAKREPVLRQRAFER
jgi:hypothetical protein